MYLMNASSKLNALNAYVTGLGASERVVVWDTTIARMTTPEIVFVFGHEMGHYVLGHIRNGILFTAGVLLMFSSPAFMRSDWASADSARPGEFVAWTIGPRCRCCFSSLLISIWFSRPSTTPTAVTSSIRPTSMASKWCTASCRMRRKWPRSSFQILGEIDLAEPAPSQAVKIWFYDHPTLDERILFAQTYDPWDRGQSPAFVK